MQEMIASVIGMIMDRAVSVYCISPQQNGQRGRNDYEYPHQV
jgi:hypothetical protein